MPGKESAPSRPTEFNEKYLDRLRKKTNPKIKRMIEKAISLVTPPESRAELYSEVSTAFSDIGLLETALGNHEKAKEDRNESIFWITEAINLDAEKADYYYQRGVNLAAIQEHRKAAHDFAKSIELDRFNKVDSIIALTKQLIELGHINHANQQVKLLFSEAKYEGFKPKKYADQASEITRQLSKLEQLTAFNKISDQLLSVTSGPFIKDNLPEFPTGNDLAQLIARGLIGEYYQHYNMAMGREISKVYIHGFGYANRIYNKAALAYFKGIKDSPKRWRFWNRDKSINIVAAFNAGSNAGKYLNTFTESMAKIVVDQYGPTLVKLQVTSMGFLCFTATILERMMVEMGNNDDLANKIRNREINSKSAFQICIANGKANYPILAKNRIFYDAADIIQGKYND